MGEEVTVPRVGWGGKARMPWAGHRTVLERAAWLEGEFLLGDMHLGVIGEVFFAAIELA